jgi:hypothetical protein
MRGLPHASRIRVPVTVDYAGSVADALRILAGRVTAMADMTRSELRAAKLMRANTCIVDVLERAWQPRRSPCEGQSHTSYAAGSLMFFALRWKSIAGMQRRACW